MIINNRFDVNVSRSEVWDKVKGMSTRLEPRLMKLLCMLIEHRGEIVKRELIIKQIWNDYPGAGEGLNQAISGLRKLLEDDQKKIIETLPKTGYCFHGTLGEPQAEPPVKLVRPFKTTYILAGTLVVIAFVPGEVLPVNTSCDKRAIILENARNISKMDSARQEERLRADKVKQ